jgi:hypothetical protein
MFVDRLKSLILLYLVIVMLRHVDLKQSLEYILKVVIEFWMLKIEVEILCLVLIPSILLELEC